MIPFSDFIKSGNLVFPDILESIYDEINEIYGIDYESPFKE